MEEILIKVGKSGEVKIETKGFKGSACKEATKTLKQALGQVTEEVPTKEAYDVSETINTRSRAKR